MANPPAEAVGTATRRPPRYPLPRECPYRPSPRTADLRHDGPVSTVRLYDGRTAWLVTGAAQARALLADPRVSNRSDFPNYPVMDERHLRMRATREMAREEEGGFAAALFGMDPPEHTRQRQLLIPRFTVRQVAALRPAIQRIVDEHLDAMAAGGSPADLVSAFTSPVPTMVVLTHLDVPYEDRARIEPAVTGLFDPDRADAAMADLTAYLDQLIRAKELAPGTGALDPLIADQLRAGTVSRAELISFALAILVAGTVTTSSALALGTLALLETPGQYAALVAQPDLLPGAVSEILRHLSLVEQLARVATEDIEIGGQRIRAGDGIIVSFAAANLDPTVTGHPDRLDVTRPPTNHLAFSHGIHHCLGQNLALLELEIAFGTLVRRFPNLRALAHSDQLPTYLAGDVPRLACLPVTW